MLSIPAPYIIIGMHRSGTSLVAQVLEKSGIFMGVVKDHNYESVPFLSLNQHTLWAADANWLEPKVPSKEHYKSLTGAEMFYEHFKTYGWLRQNLLKLKSPAWGWKDPRNTFTLPMWLEQFPKAKVIHVIRDKQAVAKSLAKRNKVTGEVQDPKLDSMNFNLKLCESYVSQGKSYASILGKNYIEIQYEDLLVLDASKIKELEDFCKKPLLANFKTYVKASV